MLKGGITYCNRLTTVSNTYAGEIQTEEYGEGLAEHLRYHQNKIRGIVNGIDINIWNPSTDKLLKANYDAKTAIENKKKNKKALQEFFRIRGRRTQDGNRIDFSSYEPKRT